MLIPAGGLAKIKLNNIGYFPLFKEIFNSGGKIKEWEKKIERELKKHPSFLKYYLENFVGITEDKIPEYISLKEEEIENIRRFDPVEIDRIITSLYEECTALREIKGDLKVIVFLGLKTSNAFQLIEGEKAYLGIDLRCFSELKQLKIWFPHELSHLFRYSTGKGMIGDRVRNEEEYSIGKLYNKLPLKAFPEDEGLSGRFSKKIEKGLPEHNYLGFTERQYKWCENNKDRIINEVRPLLNVTPGTKVYTSCFLGETIGWWRNSSPHKSGYYIGLKMVEEEGPDEI